MPKYTFDSERHIHLLDGKPLIGTTTALDVLGKPLTWWASGMCAAEFGWKNSKLVKSDERLMSAKEHLEYIKTMNPGSYLELLDKAYKAHNTKKEKSADEGIDLHSAVEEYIKGEMTGQGVLIPDPRLETFRKWCEVNVKQFLFSEVNCYSERLWCGGIVDFGYISKDGKFILGDVKSSKDAYFSHFVQMGGYDIQLSENGGFTASGDKVFTCPKEIAGHGVFHFGGGFKPTFSWGVLRNRRSFESALSLYKDRQNYEECAEVNK